VTSSPPSAQESITGDTLCDENHPVVYEAMASRTRSSACRSSRTGGDRDKLGEVLGKLMREDPTFKA
jgi:elongation factor G